MSEPGAPTDDEIRLLRQSNYNATIAEIVVIHDDLWIFRIVPDAGVPRFEPGQYVSIGLGNWEPRVAGAQAEQLSTPHLRKLCKRAYSVSCSLMCDDHRVLRVSEYSYLELYILLVRSAARHPPALTPRLFMLKRGDRLFVSDHAMGQFTLSAVQPHNDVFFFATGTGEAPHNAMIAEMLARGHLGRIVNAVCVRQFRDAAYREQHTELVRRYAQYSYHLLTTREPENLDSSLATFVGKKYLQSIVQNGELERNTNVSLNPATAHVFLCGSPEMIGAVKRSAGVAVPTALAGSMLELLIRRGFQPDLHNQPGNVHFEEYW